MSAGAEENLNLTTFQEFGPHNYWDRLGLRETEIFTALNKSNQESNGIWGLQICLLSKTQTRLPSESPEIPDT